MSQQSVQAQAEKLESNLDIKDRKYRFKTYKNCFIGSDAVNTIIQLNIALNEEAAVEFGNTLIHNNLIEHVIKDHLFKNKKLFYRFTKNYYDAKLKLNANDVDYSNETQDNNNNDQDNSNLDDSQQNDDSQHNQKEKFSEYYDDQKDPFYD